MLLALVTIFLVQTWLVYTDPVGRESAPLTAEASRGQELWHAHNCQSCHQVYGFGGFLGPDLTNAANQLTDERLSVVLTSGTDVMPAFHMSSEERAAVRTFLVELDLTGQGQVRAADAMSPRTLFESLFRGTATPDEPILEREERGLTILLEKNCIDCHLPNVGSAYRAADMTRMSGRLGRDGLAAILAAGVPGKAMPVFVLPTPDIDAIHAALDHLEGHGDTVRAGFENAGSGALGALFALPWFEYPRPAEQPAPTSPTPTDS